MSGGGHLADMNSRIKQNRELLKGKRTLRKQMSLISKTKFGSLKLKFKKSNLDQLEQIRVKALKDNNKGLRIQAIKVILGVIIVFLLIYLFIGNVLLDNM